jgi:hypothetical protein
MATVGPWWKINLGRRSEGHLLITATAQLLVSQQICIIKNYFKMIEAFPLDWPIGYKRTRNRINSKFKQTMDEAQNFLRAEINRLGGKGLIVSSNIPIRKDGGLYADWMNKRIDDPGIAIFFKYQEKEVTMCCDQYERVWENIYALGKGIEALRGMERWGVSEFLERAFTGFKALPAAFEMPAPTVNWWNVLEMDENATYFEVKKQYRILAQKYHPDNKESGNAEKFIQIQKAYENAIRIFGVS